MSLSLKPQETLGFNKPHHNVNGEIPDRIKWMNKFLKPLCFSNIIGLINKSFYTGKNKHQNRTIN